jgi:hypothetical protein
VKIRITSTYIMVLIKKKVSIRFQWWKNIGIVAHMLITLQWLEDKLWRWLDSVLWYMLYLQPLKLNGSGFLLNWAVEMLVLSGIELLQKTFFFLGKLFLQTYQECCVFGNRNFPISSIPFKKTISRVYVFIV